MRHALSTHLFVQHRLTTALLDRIQGAGVPAVEIFCARQHLDYHNRNQINELKHWFKDSTLELHSLHSPMYNDDSWGKSGPDAVIRITERVKTKRVPIVDEIKRALEIAESIPFRYLVQHLGGPTEEYSEWGEEAAFTSLEELSVFARQRGVEILLENIPNGFSSAKRLVQFLRTTHLPLGLILDVGHANLNEGVASAFETMKDRLRSTHIHDNDGERDSHLFPLTSEGGTIDWTSTMALLRSREEQYPLLLELKEVDGLERPLDAVLEVFEKLEDLEQPQ